MTHSVKHAQRKNELAVLLDGVSCYLEPREMGALMGPSGSGVCARRGPEPITINVRAYVFLHTCQYPKLQTGPSAPISLCPYHTSVSGKTTLLDILAGRKTTGDTKGEVSLRVKIRNCWDLKIGFSAGETKNKRALSLEQLWASWLRE